MEPNTYYNKQQSNHSNSDATVEGQSYEYINKQCCCFNLRKISRAITQYYDRSLESLNIRSTQFTLLVALSVTSSKTLTEIAELLVMDRTTLTRNLKPLSKMELITTLHTADKRAKAYTLTDKGKHLLVQSVPLWKAAQDSVVNGIGHDNYQDIMHKLENLLKMLNLIK